MKLRKISKFENFLIGKELEKLVTIIISLCDITFNIGKNLGNLFSPAFREKGKRAE